MSEEADLDRLAADAIAEVAALHAFFEAWFLGRIGDDDASFAPLARALAEEFTMITPDGTAVDRALVLDQLRTMHGVHAGGSPPFRIEIKEARARPLGAHACLVTYQEWQTLEGAGNRRASTAVLMRRANVPDRLSWLHVHETWLPRDET